MRRAEVVRQLIEDSGLSQKAFAEKAGLPYTTLRSMLNRGFGGAAVDNVLKVTKALGLTVDELERLSGAEDVKQQNNTNPFNATELAEFEEFISNPENNLFFKELIESPEKRIEDLRKVWEIIKRTSEDDK